MRPLIAGNWKMHGLTPQLDQIKTIAASVKATPPNADVLICVPRRWCFGPRRQQRAGSRSVGKTA
ncbi:MAG: hypothetical protein M3T55_00805, partial [Pseudomonadota bacterium]|nr:hypothetical protein [Pseudomonadota bacterium]